MSQMLAVQHNVSDIERMARGIAASKLFGITNPEQALALCLVAQAEGRHPASAAQDYHIIQGRPSKKADAMLRDFLTAGGKVEWHKLDDQMADATFSHPAGGSVRISWDMDRAKQAQISTPMWKKYPRQMLRARVVSEGVRTVFPMATSGMYVPEEVVEFEPKDVTPANGKEQEAQGTAPKDVTPVLIEGTAAPKQMTKYAAKKLMAEMIAEMRSCQTVEELNILWNSKPFKDAYLTLPNDWQTGESSITAEKEELAAMLNGEHPTQRVPPNFDNIAPDDSLATGQFKASVAVERIVSDFKKAETPEALAAVWDAKVQAPEGSEAALYLTKAYTERLDELEGVAE